MFAGRRSAEVRGSVRFFPFLSLTGPKVADCTRRKPGQLDATEIEETWTKKTDLFNKRIPPPPTDLHLDGPVHFPRRYHNAMNFFENLLRRLGGRLDCRFHGGRPLFSPDLPRGGGRETRSNRLFAAWNRSCVLLMRNMGPIEKAVGVSQPPGGCIPRFGR